MGISKVSQIASLKHAWYKNAGKTKNAEHSPPSMFWCMWNECYNIIFKDEEHPDQMLKCFFLKSIF